MCHYTGGYNGMSLFFLWPCYLFAVFSYGFNRELCLTDINRKAFDTTFEAVSYTHLDVYKRQA